MNLLNKQKASLSSWQVAKFLWLAQAVSSLCFGIPLVIMILFAANVALPVIQGTILLYLGVSFFVFVPFNGVLSLILLKPVKKILNKNHEEGEAVTKEELWAVTRLLSLPLRSSFITFFASFLGFVFGLFILWLGLIPELMPIIGIIITLGLAVGFAACVIQAFLVIILLENYFRTQIENLPPFYFKTTRTMKIRKLPLFWKIFFLTFFSVTVTQVALSSLYLGRVAIYSPEDIKNALISEDIKNALIYVSVVVVLTLIYIVIVTIFFSRNLIYPLKKIILWADKIIKGETREEISLITNDEFTEVIEYLRQMQEKLEDAKISLEIKVKARTEELERLTEQQEEIIQERVKEIQKKAEDMERFQKLTVGRELKMIEFKREIKRLKNQLKSKG